MLIYNYQKELVGIDESNLKTLGFSNLSQLINEVNDFADLFVKTPGYIHNFKHVHWIDFVTCAESNQESKVIINVNGKNFRCNLDIKGIYLKDDLDNMGYVINLVNLRALSQAEYELAKKDIEQKSVTKPKTSIDLLEDEYEEITFEKEHEEAEKDSSEVDDTISMDDFNTFQDPIKDIYDNEPLDLEYENIQATKETEQKSTTPLHNQVLEVGNDYVYSPQLACDELGLPLELIEEFVQDFIAQANDFKVDLYNSLSDQNLDNVKILSHKLKGVAANLRIEDAFEVLTIVNSSEDLLELENSLNMFYEIVDKLANKKDYKEQMPIQENLEDKESEDDMILSFKDEDEIKDSDIPQKIELPELADDDFISIELDEEMFEPKQEQEIQVHYDRVKAASEIGIGTNDFNELFDDFIREAKEYTQQIQKAIEDNNFEASKNSSVKLKRMCETMRIDSFDEELDSIIKTQDADAIEQALASINTKLNFISSLED